MIPGTCFRGFSRFLSIGIVEEALNVNIHKMHHLEKLESLHESQKGNLYLVRFVYISQITGLKSGFAQKSSPNLSLHSFSEKHLGQYLANIY